LANFTTQIPYWLDQGLAEFIAYLRFSRASCRVIKGWMNDDEHMNAAFKYLYGYLKYNDRSLIGMEVKTNITDDGEVYIMLYNSINRFSIDIPHIPSSEIDFKLNSLLETIDRDISREVNDPTRFFDIYLKLIVFIRS
jgi:hypothetical protein